MTFKKLALERFRTENWGMFMGTEPGAVKNCIPKDRHFVLEACKRSLSCGESDPETVLLILHCLARAYLGPSWAFSLGGRWGRGLF